MEAKRSLIYDPPLPAGSDPVAIRDMAVRAIEFLMVVLQYDDIEGQHLELTNRFYDALVADRTQEEAQTLLDDLTALATLAQVVADIGALGMKAKAGYERASGGKKAPNAKELRERLGRGENI